MENIKHIIREVSPEATDFSFYFDDDGIKEAGGDYCYNLFIVTFDRWGRGSGFQIDEYNKIAEELYDVADSFSMVPGDMFPTFKRAMEYHGFDYSPTACHKLKEITAEYDEKGADPETIAAYLTFKTGRPWDVVSARGYNQGDYCQVVYCKDFHEEPKAYGEIWLGAGKEFCVIDLDDDGNEVGTVYGYIVADCQAWKDEDYKRLVCEWAGISPEETMLKMIDGSHTWTEYEYRTA